MAQGSARELLGKEGEENWRKGEDQGENDVCGRQGQNESEEASERVVRLEEGVRRRRGQWCEAEEVGVLYDEVLHDVGEEVVDEKVPHACQLDLAKCGSGGRMRLLGDVGRKGWQTVVAEVPIDATKGSRKINDPVEGVA